MLINRANLNSLRVGFQTTFQAGLGQAPSMYPRVATVVPSSVREEKYGWLGKIPSVREWIGPRVVQNISEYDYAIKNKSWELTIGVDRDDIDDDNLGMYAPLFTEMGLSTGSHTDQLVFSLLKAGFTTACYDGQYFFDADHPVLDAGGAPQSVANTDGGSGTPWFLLCLNRAIKPVIFQKRKDWQFVSRDKLDDDSVFNNKEFQYGADARGNVGFGLWQLAWGSKQTLDATHYKAALSALEGMKGDFDRPLGLSNFTLVVPPSLRENGQKLIVSEYASGGESNPWKGTAELLVVPWLA
ncbi:Mu-like prophage major head subunit gpT family protein [Rhodopseudomonas pseudopalustris]|uniref:Mu-like prophage major head subunit gpT n=1 Tax=Rhodopseudomonas pseudopalustris TaxID=1513892 RepID=A0A1H8V8Q2_9BRAD|nr:Mu-like prophage major head subunit gpT family protein [Rhodopseudomonas pseudopalustris]SEP11815.1 Mu-like prophage major head subunit gpT [Rhodopseudomonas pseudopalustris]